MPFSFEDKIDEIDCELRKKSSRWTLKAIPSIDYDDISQLIRLHIYKQWDKWDQTRPLAPWISMIISNQIINFMRNLYGNYARPCVAGNNGTQCPANQGDGSCAIYGRQCSDCPLYASWEKSKKNAFDIKLPLSIENEHVQDVFDRPEDGFDLPFRIEQLHNRLKEVLSPYQFKIYEMLFIQGKSEEDIAACMGYKTNEKTRDPGYRQLSNVRRDIITKAKKIIDKEM